MREAVTLWEKILIVTDRFFFNISVKIHQDVPNSKGTIFVQAKNNFLNISIAQCQDWL